MVNKKKKAKKAEAVHASCAFQVAVENTVDVKNGFCEGIKAIKKSDRSKVHADDTKKIQGSLDIDTQVRTLYPEGPRWDYALSYDDKIYFFEVHPAETSEVDKVIKKVKWLKDWLKNKATEIDKLPKSEHPYTWIQSGHYGILATANVTRKLAVAGITTANMLKLK